MKEKSDKMIQECQEAGASVLAISWQDSHSQAEGDWLEDYLERVEQFVLENILCFPVLYTQCSLLPSL